MSNLLNQVDSWKEQVTILKNQIPNIFEQLVENDRFCTKISMETKILENRIEKFAARYVTLDKF